MPKINMLLLILVLLLCSACSNQAPPLQTTPTEASLPALTDTREIPADTAVAPTETSLPTINLADQYPLIISSSDLFNQVVAIDPADPRRMAYCAPEEIRVSDDSGQTWTPVSTNGVAAAARQNELELFYGQPGSEDACLSVILDPNQAGTFYAIFTAAHREYGAPPVYYVGFFTADRGATWQLVTPPENSTLIDFGGFWNLGTGLVQAYFFPAGSWSQNPDEVLISETVDGGSTWQAGKLACPAVGPCLRWGPAPSSVPGMGSPLPQSIFYSADKGDTWSVIDPPVELRAPSPNQLVMLSDSQVLIVSGGINLSAEAPVIRTSLDGGATWQPFSLPPLSTETMDADYFPGLQYLTDGAFLSQGQEESNWYYLPSEISLWCPINTGQLPPYTVLLQNTADRVWWVNPVTQEAENVTLEELNCAVK